MRTLLSLSTNVAAVTSVVNQQCKRTTDYTWAKFDLCKCWQPQSDGPSFAEIYLFTTQPDQLHYVLKEIRGFGFQVLGSLSVKLGFRIPKPRIPDSTSKKFPGFYMGRKSANNIACVAWRFWLGALSNKGGRRQSREIRARSARERAAKPREK